MENFRILRSFERWRSAVEINVSYRDASVSKKADRDSRKLLSASMNEWLQMIEEIQNERLLQNKENSYEEVVQARFH